jgi:adenylate cyclase
MDGLSVSGLADLAGVTEAEVARLVELGILVAREGAGPFLETDVHKVRLAAACEQAGLPMAGIAAAIRAGRLSFAFLETALYRRWAVRSGPTYQQVSQETGVPLELLGGFLEAMGFAPMTPEESITEGELEVVPLLQRGFASGLLDLAWFTRVGRAHAEGLVERIEDELEAAGMLGRPGRVPAMVFLDLVGYTRLTEERGDQVAAALAETLAVLVGRSARAHGGVPVKWLGDGVMVWFREPAAAVGSALELVAQLPAAGLPPAHVGVAAGPVVIQGGDYFGRTVNLAARIAGRAGAGQVLVSAGVAEAPPPEGVRYVALGQRRLKGFAQPVRLLEAGGHAPPSDGGTGLGGGAVSLTHGVEHCAGPVPAGTA